MSSVVARVVIPWFDDRTTRVALVDYFKGNSEMHSYYANLILGR
jgi:hypothetical protein